MKLNKKKNKKKLTKNDLLLLLPFQKMMKMMEHLYLAF